MIIPKKNIICVFFLLFLFLTSTKKSFASTILYQDNFDDNNVIDWTISRNTCSSTWQAINQRYGIIISTPCITETIPSSLIIPPSVDYSFEVDMSMPNTTNMDRNFVFKYLNSSNWYGIHTLGTNLYLHKVVNGTEYFLNNWHTIYPFVANNTYHFKVIVKSSSYEIYVNDILHAIVPESGATFFSNKAGLQASSGGVPNSEVWFDNLVVTQLDAATAIPTITPTPSPTPTATPTPTPTATPTPTPVPTLPSLNVPDIKQFSLPWGNQIYDTATLWSTNPFISSWGCALTSASMVLQYFGHTWATPENLNNWLKTQVDGYIRNGLINWLAVSRYTLLNNSATSPTLEYRRITPTTANLAYILKDSKPGILGEPGHFIVGKSIIPGTFGINDPAYADRSNLGSYGNSLISLGVYTPTHTDLSYIYLVIDTELEIRVIDSSDNEIGGFTQIDDPIIDPQNPEADSGQSLKSFMFPTPPDGTYRVVLTGNGLYQLDSYLYDVEGNVVSNSFQGILTDSQGEELNMNIGGSSQISPEITIDSIIRDLDEAYSFGLIRPRRVFLEIKSQFSSARKYLTRGRIRQAKTVLSLTSMAVRLYTPIFIDPTVSKILRNNVKVLDSSL